MTSQLPSGRGSSRPSHISLVEPLRPEWPSCRPIFAVDRRWTKRVIAAHWSRCPSVHSPGQPGVIRPSGDTQVISVITRPAPPRALDPRWTRWNSPGTPSSALYMSIEETMTRFFSLSGPIRAGVNIAGTLGGAPDSMAVFAIGRAAGGYGGSSPREITARRANSLSIRAANSSSRSLRFAKVIRRDRVSRLKANCAGSCPAYMPMFSNHSSEACAARWVDSTTGLRSAW